MFKKKSGRSVGLATAEERIPRRHSDGCRHPHLSPHRRRGGRLRFSWAWPALPFIGSGPCWAHPPRPKGSPTSPRIGPLRAHALSPDERASVLAVLHMNSVFRTAPPAATYRPPLCWTKVTTIAPRAPCAASSRKGRRVRRTAGSSSCTRRITNPELLATAPNQLWSWDITKPC